MSAVAIIISVLLVLSLVLVVLGIKNSRTLFDVAITIAVLFLLLAGIY